MAYTRNKICGNWTRIFLFAWDNYNDIQKQFSRNRITVAVCLFVTLYFVSNLFVNVTVPFSCLMEEQATQTLMNVKSGIGTPSSQFSSPHLANRKVSPERNSRGWREFCVPYLPTFCSRISKCMRCKR
jgi:hypothetical protein